MKGHQSKAGPGTPSVPVSRFSTVRNSFRFMRFSLCTLFTCKRHLTSPYSYFSCFIPSIIAELINLSKSTLPLYTLLRMVVKEVDLLDNFGLSLVCKAALLVELPPLTLGDLGVAAAVDQLVLHIFHTLGSWQAVPIETKAPWD